MLPLYLQLNGLKRSFEYWGTVLWNSLSESTRTAKSLNVFKQLISSLINYRLVLSAYNVLFYSFCVVAIAFTLLLCTFKCLMRVFHVWIVLYVWTATGWMAIKVSLHHHHYPSIYKCEIKVPPTTQLVNSADQGVCVKHLCTHVQMCLYHWYTDQSNSAIIFNFWFHTLIWWSTSQKQSHGGGGKEGGGRKGKG